MKNSTLRKNVLFFLLFSLSACDLYTKEQLAAPDGTIDVESKKRELSTEAVTLFSLVVLLGGVALLKNAGLTTAN